MRSKILIYSDRESFTSTSYLEGELSRMFKDMTIQPLNRHQLAEMDVINNNTFLFVLPGIIGEECLYPAHIGTKGFSKITDFINNGGAYLGLCAGAYHALSTIKYEPPTILQPKLQNNTNRFIAGVASGPIATHYVPDEADNDFSGCTTITLLVDGSASFETDICYGNGPILYPAEGEDYKIIARYKDVEGQPPAIILKQFGNGLVIASGVVPQYGAEPVLVEKMRLNGQSPKALIALAEELSKHETGRRKLMGLIENALKEHWYTVTEQPPHREIASGQSRLEPPSSLLAARL